MNNYKRYVLTVYKSYFYYIYEGFRGYNTTADKCVYSNGGANASNYVDNSETILDQDDDIEALKLRNWDKFL